MSEERTTADSLRLTARLLRENAAQVAAMTPPGGQDVHDILKQADRWDAWAETLDPSVVRAGEEFLILWQNTHPRSRNCPTCRVDLSTTGLQQLVYTFEVCGCGNPEYDHLIEQLWHRSCFAQHVLES